MAEFVNPFVEDAAVRVAVVAPTFNHGRTLLSVLEAVERGGHVAVIIAVDDGSTDATRQTLAGWSEGRDDRIVVTHPCNRGKAAALRSGFAKAEALGFTHALTIDTDGQHDPADLPDLLAAAVDHPHALILGERPTGVAGCPLGSRVGRLFSNLLVRVESGLRVRDSQCGLRVYPLRLARRLGSSYGRYNFETAILARFAWARLPIVCRPVRCVYLVPGGRVSHFRPTRDSVAAGLMHCVLMLRAMIPGPRVQGISQDPPVSTGTMFDRVVDWLNPLPMWRQMRTEAGACRRIAAAIGVGVLIALLPLYGVKTYVCLAVARWGRLEPLPLLGISSAVSAPPIGPLLAIGSISCGSVLLRGQVPELSQYDPRQHEMLQVLRDVAIEWTIGGLLLGSLLGMAAYLTAKWLLVRRVRPTDSGVGSAEAPAA